MRRHAINLLLLIVTVSVVQSKCAAQEAAEQSPNADAAAAKPALSPEHARRLGELLRDDWKDRPEWADMAVDLLTGGSVYDMGPGRGWYKTSQKRYYWSWLRENFDTNKDRQVTRDELEGTPHADQVFSRLDRDANGAIEGQDFDWSSYSDYSMRSQMSEGVFSRLDFDSNGRLTEEEMLHFFRTADRENLGFVTPDDLLVVLDPPAPNNPGQSGPPPREDPLKWFAMLLNGELGSLTAGPDLDEKAPDFTLPTHDGESQVTLSKLVGEKPVVLVFGSFT